MLVEVNVLSGFLVKINLVVDEVVVVVDFRGICEINKVFLGCFGGVCLFDVLGVLGILAIFNVIKFGIFVVVVVFNICWFDDDVGVIDEVLLLLLFIFFKALFVILRCIIFLLFRFFISCLFLMM